MTGPLLYFVVFATVVCQVPAPSVVVDECCLVEKDESTIQHKLLFPEPGEFPMTFARDSRFRFVFQIAAQAGPAIMPISHPILRLRWNHPSHRSIGIGGGEAVFNLPPATLVPRSLFVIPAPVPPKRQSPCQPAPIRWVVWNMSGDIQNVLAKIETLDDHIYSGPKQIRLSVPPSRAVVVEGELIPTKVGPMQLPIFSLKAIAGSTAVLFDTLSRPLTLIKPK